MRVSPHALHEELVLARSGWETRSLLPVNPLLAPGTSFEQLCPERLERLWWILPIVPHDLAPFGIEDSPITTLKGLHEVCIRERPCGPITQALRELDQQIAEVESLMEWLCNGLLYSRISPAEARNVRHVAPAFEVRVGGEDQISPLSGVIHERGKTDHKWNLPERPFQAAKIGGRKKRVRLVQEQRVERIGLATFDPGQEATHPV